MKIVPALLAVALLALPARAQPTDTGLAAMLRAVPAPADRQRFMAAAPLVAYIRLDVMAGTPGPADPGASRLLAWGLAQMPALGVADMVRTVPLAELWPETVGFDLDAVDAVLTAPSGGPDPTAGIRVLAGAPRLHDSARIGERLRRRGFKQSDLDEATLFSFGEDHTIGPARRIRGDPFDTGLGRAQRIAITPDALLVTSDTETMGEALEALAGRAPSMADLYGIRAILAGLGDAQLLQALIFSPSAGLGIPLAPPPPFARPSTTGPSGPPLPTWAFAALAEIAILPDQPYYLVVLAMADPAAARAALQARIEATRSGPRPLDVASIETRVLPDRYGAFGVLVAEIHMAPGTAPMATPLFRWWIDLKSGNPTPITFAKPP